MIGSTIQAPVQTANIAAQTVATTPVQTFSGAGVVLQVGIIITSSITGTGGNVSFVDVIVDGNTLSLPVMIAAGWAPSASLLSSSNNISSLNLGVNAYASWQLNVQFNASLTIQYRITSAGNATGGTLQAGALWAHS